MSYIDRNLVPGEAVEYRTHLHWIVFAGPLVAALLGLAAVLFGVGSRYGQWILGVGLITLAVAAAATLARWLVVVTSEFAVTNKRVLIKVGVFSRHSLEILLTKVEGIGVDQRLLGRLLGYGTIVVTGTGGTREAFQRIAQPLRFRTEVQSRVPA